MIRAGGGYTAEDMRTVLEVEHANHFMDAAIAMNIAPSTLGKRVRRVERLLGVTIFDRGRRRLGEPGTPCSPTAGGELILQAFARSLDDIEDAVTLAKRTRGE